jgi:hypothetical protein
MMVYLPCTYLLVLYATILSLAYASADTIHLTVELFDNGFHTDGIEASLSLDDCSKPIEKTLCSAYFLDAEEEDCVGARVFDATGRQVVSCDRITEDKQKLYMVLKGREFVFPTHKVGHRVVLPHIATERGQVVLETMSMSPRVFKIDNLFTDKEAEDLIASAISLKEEDFRLKRSTTTSGET